MKKTVEKFCGLDFGTSNSTIGVYFNHLCQLISLEKGKKPIRSAIFCDTECKEWFFGQDGINRYLEGHQGRLMMALKSVLGSPLLDDKTVIFNEFIPYTKVLANFIQHIKTEAENTIGEELTQVVMGRPVRFHDDDVIKDQKAQNTLEKIARDIGFKEIIFQYEPIAAALTYEMSITSEQLALIIDMGGGTSDFTVIRLQPSLKSVERSEDVLANCGIHIAGTDFDQRLSLASVMPLLGMGSFMRGSSSDIEVPNSYYHDLTAWHLLNNLYSLTEIAKVRSIHTVSYEKQLIARLIQVLETRSGHHILNTVEQSKQQLSDEPVKILDLNFIENELSVKIDRNFFNEAIEQHLQRIIARILDTVKIAGIKNSAISTIFYTGGTTKIPIVRHMINELFPQANIVQGDAFGSVGMGLTLDAQRKFQSS